MLYIRKITALICTFLLCFSLCSCKDKEPTEKIYFELPQMPHTLDPQTAESSSELILVRNLYEGLLRYGKDGKLTNGTAESYKAEGLIYTFKLNSKAHWDSGEPITADDFVFGMQRAVHPKTASPFVTRFFSIENAESINRNGADINSLGVKAVDAHTLTIRLCREDSDFLHNLTTAPFMPCNRKFFEEAIGRYGLEKQCVLSNGSYYLRKWDQENFGIRIYKNAEYFGKHPALNAAVFFSNKKDSTPFRELSEKNVDVAMLSGDDIKKAEGEGFSTDSTQNICWVLTLGKDINPQMRKAFALLIDKNVFKFDLPYGAVPAESFYPECLRIDASVNRAGFLPYDAINAKKLFSDAVKATEDKKFPNTVLKYYSEGQIKDTVTAVVGHWQQKLSAFINIESTDNLEFLLTQLREPTLQMSVFPITANSPSFKDYISVFGKDSDKSPADLQKEIMAENCIIPLAFDNTSVAFSPQISGIKVEPGNGYIDFAFVIKEK